MGVGCGVSKAELEKSVAAHKKTVAELEKTVAERKMSVAAKVREDPRGRLRALEAQNAALRKLLKDRENRLDLENRPKPKPKATLRPVPSRNGK